jgi:hypothetical protein
MRRALVLTLTAATFGFWPTAAGLAATKTSTLLPLVRVLPEEDRGDLHVRSRCDLRRVQRAE